MWWHETGEVLPYMQAPVYEALYTSAKGDGAIVDAKMDVQLENSKGVCFSPTARPL